MEYVTEKADLYELNKKVKSWERKVDIAEVNNANFYYGVPKHLFYWKIKSRIGNQHKLIFL